MNWKRNFIPRGPKGCEIEIHSWTAVEQAQGMNAAPGFSPAGDRAFDFSCPRSRHSASAFAVFVAAFFLALATLAGRPALASSRPILQAQSENGAAVLSSIEITGSSRFTSTQIAAATGLRVGAQVTRADLQHAANTLAQLGPFTNIQYRYGSEPAGVVVQFQVKDAPAVPVFFDNFPWFTDQQLDAALKSASPLFDGSAPEHGTLLDSMADALGTFLVAHGLQGSVSHVLTTEVFGNQQVQEFQADDAGVTISSISFTDPLAGSDRRIHTRLSDLIGKPYSRMRIERFEFEQIRPVYLAHAYVHVQFGPLKPQLAGSDRSRVSVTAPIEPGPAYTWAGVTWTGATAISDADLNSLVKLVPGQSANGMETEATWQAVRDAFTNLGYLDVTLTPTAHYDDSVKHVSYSVAIYQGQQYRMGQLILSGLSVEGERRIRGAWKIASGEIFDASTYQNFLTHGIEKAFAGFPAHYDKIGRYLQKNPNGTVDVMMDFE